MVERQFNTKILVFQSDWGGEYQSLNTFFEHLGIAHHVSCPQAINKTDQLNANITTSWR
jgi:hypothetical protein